MFELLPPGFDPVRYEQMVGLVPGRPGGVMPLLTTLAQKNHRRAEPGLHKDKATWQHVTAETVDLEQTRGDLRDHNLISEDSEESLRSRTLL